MSDIKILTPELIETILGVELMGYQKEFLRSYIEQASAYENRIIYPAYHGRRHSIWLISQAYKQLFGLDAKEI